MASQYSHGYTYDLFISYSSRDAKWVEHFLDDLEMDTNRFADRDIFPFLDRGRLHPGYVWNEALLSAAAESCILLPIFSPRFFESDYCQKEVHTFLGAFGLKSSLLHRSRILPVKLLCSAPKDHALAAIQATVFSSEGADGIPGEFPQDSAEYREAIRRLSVSIAQLLRNIPPKELKRPAVYVAADFKAETDKLRASLAHTYDVLPQNPPGLLTMADMEVKEALSLDFSRCFASVHILSDAPMAKPLIEAQLDAARTRAKPRMILAASTPASDLLNEGFEWLKSQSELEDRLRRLIEKPEEPRARGNQPLIYFLCPDRQNKERAEPLLLELEERGIHLYPSPLEGPADQALKTHVDALDELDGCLIYYGDVDRNWFDSVFLRIAKKIRQRALPSAIFLAPPLTDHKTRDIKNMGLRLVTDADTAASAFVAGAVGAGSS